MFSRIESIKDRVITGSFENLEAVVNYVKSADRPEVKHIIRARKLEKGSAEYRQIKTDEIPCTTINFTHSGYIRSSTITDPTGYMFLDVDDDTLGDVDMNYVAAYWRSLSNHGYSVIVKVSGLSANNLKQSYRQVGELLDIAYDKAAISKDRLTVLSYDSEAYFSTDYKEVELFQEKKTHFNTIKNTLSLGYQCNGSFLRYDNLDETIAKLNFEISYDGDGVFDFGKENKLKYSKCHIPFRKIKKGKRNTVLSSIIHQLIALNPSYNKEHLHALTHAVNSSRMDPPLSNKEVQAKFEYKYIQRNSLKPILNATRRFLYDPEKRLTTSEKSRYNAKRMAQDKVNKTKEQIKEVLLNWDYDQLGKITNKKVASQSGLNIKTVNKYCKSIKNDIKTKT
jgi:hypothetical protein